MGRIGVDLKTGCLSFSIIYIRQNSTIYTPLSSTSVSIDLIWYLRTDLHEIYNFVYVFVCKFL